VVYGQGGSFTSATVNSGGVSASSLNRPFGVALDSSSGVYAVDEGNNRMLYFPNGSTTATRVYGQPAEAISALESRAASQLATSTPVSSWYAARFTTDSANLGGVLASSLSLPRAVALGSNGVVCITDSGNHRVLQFAQGSTYATVVFGQSNFSASLPNQGFANPTANTLSNPLVTILDANNNVYIADTGSSARTPYALLQQPAVLWLADCSSLAAVLSAPCCR